MFFCRQCLTLSICVLGLISCNGADKLGHQKSRQSGAAKVDPITGTEALSADSESVGTEGKQSPLVSGASATRAEIFRNSLYPLLKEHCSGTSCHNKATSPLIAQEDYDQAWTAAAGKIDFEQASASILSVRLAVLAHQCWTNCAADATTMTNAIQSLQDKLAAASLLPKSTLQQSAPVAFANALTAVSEANENSVVLYAKDSKERSAAFVEKSDKDYFDRDAKIKDYVELPLNSPAATITYSMSLPKTGNYFLWVRAKHVDDANFTTLTATVNGVPSPSIGIGVDPAGWAWYLLPSPSGNNVGEVDAAAMLNSPKLNLADGANNDAAIGAFMQLSGKIDVVISDVSGEFRINRIALTTQGRDYTGDDVTRPVKVLKVPINELCGGKNVSLRVEVEEFDAKSKAISIRNLRIENSEKVTIKGIEVLINGKYSPLNTTFRIVDAEVASPGKLLIRSALLAIGEKGFLADQLSFAIDKCK